MNKYHFDYQIKRCLQGMPRVYQWLLALKHRDTIVMRRLVRPDFDVCIEGYPRSANSFSVKAFKIANNTEERNFKIATHMHSSAQVRESVRLGVPTLVLIRNPEDAIISLKALSIQLQKVKDPELYPMDILVWKYIDFYQPLFRHEDQICVATFDQVTNRYDEVIARLNKQFQTSFKCLESKKENEEEVFKQGKVHLSPSPERQQIKENLEREMDALKDSKEMNEARRIYDEFSSLANH